MNIKNLLLGGVLTLALISGCITQVNATGNQSSLSAQEEEQLSIRLINAAGEGNIAEVDELIIKGANTNCVDYCGNTPLIWAIGLGHTEIVKLLLDNGANVNQANIWGGTALIQAAIQDRTEIVKLLLAKDANVNQASNNNKNTPLIFAAHNGHTDIVDMLLTKGANVNHISKRVNTALYGAIKKKHHAIVASLLHHDAEIDEDLLNNPEYVKVIDEAKKINAHRSGAAKKIQKASIEAMYRPGGEGFKKAKAHFANLAATRTTK